MRGTRFHLIRHGEYALTGRVLGGRAPGHALNDRGRAQADALADQLAGVRLGAVVSSPLERARETALPIAACQKLDVTVEPDLHEIDFGAWTGLPFDVLDDRPDWRNWNAQRGQAVPPGGEGMQAVQARAVAALQRLHRAHPDHDVAVISHGDVIRGALLHALGMPLDSIHRIEVAPGSRSVLTLSGGQARVESLNDLPDVFESM